MLQRSDPLIWLPLGLVLGLLLGPRPATSAPRPGDVRAVAPRAVHSIGLELREGGLEPSAPRAKAAPTARPRPAPSEAPSPAPEPVQRNPVEEAVDAVVRRQLAGGLAAASGAELAAQGAPLSAPAKRAVADIARAAGLDVAQVASVANTPRDQAQFLVEQLLDAKYGESYVRGQYGLAGAVAAEGFRRMRDVYQILDISPTQKHAVVAVVESALLATGAAGQVEHPDYEQVDVDPGARADRARFEKAIAASAAVARCLRPAGQGERAYLLEIPRRGAWLGGAACREPWAPPTLAGPSAASATNNSGSAGTGGSRGANAVGIGQRLSSNPGPAGGSSTGAIEVTPLPSPATSSDGLPKYIVTDGPQGPAVTVVPGR